jgi:hypothetical protein
MEIGKEIWKGVYFVRTRNMAGDIANGVILKDGK